MTLRLSREELAELAAVRELMNTYNLGGWTDAVAPMQRALKAEAESDALRAFLIVSANAVESVAFTIAAPNQFTPQLVGTAVDMRKAALDAALKEKP